MECFYSFLLVRDHFEFTVFAVAGQSERPPLEDILGVIILRVLSSQQQEKVRPGDQHLGEEALGGVVHLMGPEPVGHVVGEPVRARAPAQHYH